MPVIQCFPVLRIQFVFALFCVMSAFSDPSLADKLQPGSRYEIIRPVYLTADYYDVSNKLLSRETARAYLDSFQLARRYFTAFQCQVPAGTVMTIIGPAPKVWPLPFFAERYFVRLDPDISRGLEVQLALNRGMEGNLDGLNPEIFRIYVEPEQKSSN